MKKQDVKRKIKIVKISYPKELLLEKRGAMNCANNDGTGYGCPAQAGCGEDC